MKLFKWISLFLTSAILLNPLSARAESPEIAALILYASNPYWVTLENGLKDTAKALNIKIDIYALADATDAEGQLNQCETALLKNPKAIIFAAVDGVNLGSCLKKASAKGILLIDIDGNTTIERAKKMGANVAFSVASNNYELGKKAAQYLKGDKGKVLILEGLSASQPGRLRVQGFNENLPAGLAVVASQPGDWDRLKGADVVSRVILQHPDLSVIFAANDAMALGGIEALRAAHMDSVKVIGIDGTAEAVKSIQEGRLTATIAQLPYLMAKRAVEKAHHYLQDKKPLPFNQYVPIMTLDKATLARHDDPLLAYVR